MPPPTFCILSFYIFEKTHKKPLTGSGSDDIITLAPVSKNT
jgi:hypothetical protein